MANRNPKNKWKKGKSGNPKGRPLESWSEALRRVGERLAPGTKKKYKELVSEQVWLKALQGDMKAINTLMDRMEGYPHQSTDITSGGEPIPILGGTTNVQRNDRHKKAEKADKKD